MKALITGVTGQDGSYLAELLLSKGYEVHGIKRRASSFNTDRIDHLYQDPHEKNRQLILHYGDLTDSTNLIRVIQSVQPDEIYNLGAQSHAMSGLFIVSQSWLNDACENDWRGKVITVFYMTYVLAIGAGWFYMQGQDSAVPEIIATAPPPEPVAQPESETQVEAVAETAAPAPVDDENV